MKKPIKINGPQTATLLELRRGPRGSYPGLNMGTLAALERKGFVKATRGLGSIAMPHTAIKWSLTDMGREFVEHVASTGFP